MLWRQNDTKHDGIKHHGHNVEDDQDPEDGVVGSQSVNGAELPIIYYIDPGGEEQDLGHGVQDDLQHQQGRGLAR